MLWIEIKMVVKIAWAHKGLSLIKHYIFSKATFCRKKKTHEKATSLSKATFFSSIKK
jgi:hypothetical protein